ncbi:MAG TPA: PKD domain-containing protein [Thermoplasmata archaeon]|nr:PKD domain-containing protein [Thermoplasmata archaeon]
MNVPAPASNHPPITLPAGHLPASPFGSVPQPGWVSIRPAQSPEARSGAMMAFDSSDGYLVLFGGWNGTYLNDTWTYSGGVWTPLPTPVAPSGRAYGAMIYDASDGQLVLFGGFNGSFLGDTWTFVHGVWHELPPGYGPAARSRAGMAFDEADGMGVLFGGLGTRGPSSDTWTFHNDRWARPLLHSGSPPARAGAAMSFDAGDGRILLFGGNSTRPLNDTWEYRGGAWAPVNGSVSPPARGGASLAWDPTDDTSLLFGGANGTTLGDTWGFHSGSWTPWTDGPGPGVRSDATLAFDAADGYIVLFGGAAGIFLADTWGFRAAPSNLTWSALPAGLTPPGRTQAGMTYDAYDGYVVLFGGHQGAGGGPLFGDTWTYRAGVWAELHPPVSPSPRRAALFVYDAADGYVVLFGGSSARGYLNDTWEFRAGIWKRVHTAVAPAPRRSMGGTFDAADGYVLMFGGHAGTGRVYRDFNDSWCFRAGHWTELSNESPPSARAEPVLSFDPATGTSVLFDGYVDGARHIRLEDDTWSFAHGTWTLLCRPCAPAQRDGAGVAFDPRLGALVVYGGHNNSTVLGDTWALSGGGWFELCGVCGPQVRDAPSLTFDSADGYLLLFGGGYPTFLDRTSPWALVPPVRVTANGTPAEVDVGVPVQLLGAFDGPWAGYSTSWSLGDGNASTLADPQYAYARPGDYNATFVVRESTGLVTMATIPIRVNPRPALTLTGYPSTIDAGQSVNLSAVVSGGTGTVSVGWNFADGSGSSGLDSVARFASPGTYTIECWANDSEVSSSANLTIVVDPDTTALASVSAPTTDLGVRERFSVQVANGTGPYTAFWKFGDGASGTGLTVNHSYARSGVFTVQAWVNDSTGYDSEQNLTVRVNPVPQVSANESAAIVDVGAPIDFSAAAYGGTAPFTYLWNFSSGTNATGPSAAVRPAQPGALVATVVLTDAAGDSASASLPFRAVPVPAATIDLSSNVTEPGVPFQANAVVAGGVAPLRYNWSFGDGGFAAGATTNHTYGSNGTFVVQLVVSDADGATALASSNMTVGPAPGLVLRLVGSQGGLNGSPFNVTFAAQGSGGLAPYNVTWSFGDGSVGWGPGPVHEYNSSGNYTVTARLIDAAGVRANASLNITLNATGAYTPSTPPPPSPRTGVTSSPVAGLSPPRGARPD